MTLIVAFRQNNKNYLAADKYVTYMHPLTEHRIIDIRESKVFSWDGYYMACAWNSSIADQCEILSKSRVLTDSKKWMYEIYKEIARIINEELLYKTVNFCIIIITKDNIWSIDNYGTIANRNFYAVGSVDEVAKYLLYQNTGKVLRKLPNLFKYYAQVIDGVGEEFDLVSI